MKSLTRKLWFETRKRHEFIDLTGQVVEAPHDSGIQEELLLVNAIHITTS